MTRRFVVQGRYASGKPAVVSEHDEELQARNGLKEALRIGLHHASISDTTTVPWTVVDVRTRRPRIGDWITGVTPDDGGRFTGRITAIEFDLNYLAEVFEGDRAGGERIHGERVVTFERFDVDAVAGIHFQPDKLRLPANSVCRTRPRPAS